MIYKIHRLCRDTKTIEKLKKEEKKFNLPKTEYVTGIDLFTFINYITRDCKEDYALICHDDVILPLNISEKVELCIKSANDFLGEDKCRIGLGSSFLSSYFLVIETFSE